MARFPKVATFAVVFMLAFGGAVQAFGATLPWQSVDVILHEEGSNAVMLISGTLPEDAALPAEVSLSVPTGAEIQWTGEILGGDPKNDLSVTPTKSTVEGADVYTFTLTKARIGQVEAIVPPSAREGSTSSASIKWVSSQDVPEVRMSGRVPTGSTVDQPVEGAELTPGSDGFSYYSKTFTDVSAGDDLDLTFAYTAPAAAPAPAPAGSAGAGAQSSNTGGIVFILLIVAAGVAVFAIAVSRKLSGKAGGNTASATPAEKKASAAPARSESSKSTKGTPTTAAAPRRKLSPTTVMLLVMVIVLAGGIFALAQSSKPPVVDGLMTRTFGGLGACTTAALPLTPAAGVDLAKDGNKLVDSLAGVESVGQVTLDVPKALITVQYCDSSTDEQTIKATLASTGLVVW